MPPILYFQTSTRDQTHPVRLNYAWSTVGFPTLFVSQSFDNRTCQSGSFSVDVTEYEKHQQYGSVDIAGSGSVFSLAIVFRRLIRFDGGSKNEASDVFDPSQAGDETYESVYLNDSIEWTYDEDKRRINGTSPGQFGSLLFSVSS